MPDYVSSIAADFLHHGRATSAQLLIRPLVESYSFPFAGRKAGVDFHRFEIIRVVVYMAEDRLGEEVMGLCLSVGWGLHINSAMRFWSSTAQRPMCI
jgi:hypothetical protein